MMASRREPPARTKNSPSRAPRKASTQSTTRSQKSSLDRRTRSSAAHGRAQASRQVQPVKIWRVGPSRRRFQWLAGSAIVVMVCLVLRSADVQVVRGADLRADGVNQRESYVKVPAARGSIFDRDGNELAVTVPALSLYANPQAIVDPVASAQVLAQMLGLDLVSEGELAAKLANRSSTFVYVQRFVDPALVESVLALQLSGVNSVTEPKRVQVAGTLARNVIGRTDPFGEGSTGLELQYDKILRGVDGRKVRDSSR
ncbi:MAG: hypothetical protein RL119_1435, partial [Actinomycetota bacterium]